MNENPEQEDLDVEVNIDFKEMLDHSTQIQGKVIADLTKDLSAQRSISSSLKKMVLQLRSEIAVRDEHLQEIQKELEQLKNPPIKDLEHAELVVDQLIEERTTAARNGSKPPAKPVSSSS